MKEVLVKPMIYLLLFLKITSCVNSNHELINCKNIDGLSKLDQLYRNDLRCNPIAYIIDSLSNHDTAFYEKNYEKAVNIYRAKDGISFTKGFIDQKLSDSLFKLQVQIDRKQVNRISIWLKNIEKNRIDTLDCYFDILFILAHTPNDMRPEILKIVKMKKSYISNDTYDYLINALSLK